MDKDRFDLETLWIMVRGVIAIIALLSAFILYVSNDTNGAIVAGVIFIVLFLNVMK